MEKNSKSIGLFKKKRKKIRGRIKDTIFRHNQKQIWKFTWIHTAFFFFSILNCNLFYDFVHNSKCMRLIKICVYEKKKKVPYLWQNEIKELMRNVNIVYFAQILFFVCFGCMHQIRSKKERMGLVWSDSMYISPNLWLHCLHLRANVLYLLTHLAIHPCKNVYD